MEQYRVNPEQDPHIVNLRPLIESGLDDILPQLIEIFLETAPRTIELARKALEDSQAEELSKAAHSLRGSCSNFGAERLRELCARLDDVGRIGSLQGAPELFESVEKEFVRVRAELLFHLERIAEINDSR
ncbi:MAG: Hpt domain-containing protein [Terrimicrobiaceae bacterium]